MYMVKKEITIGLIQVISMPIVSQLMYWIKVQDNIYHNQQ